MKALIVMDLPDNLNKSIEEIRVNIKANLYGVELLDWRNQLIKPMPERKGQHHEIPADSLFPMLDGIAVLMDGVNAEYNEGWNDCVDELLRENKE